MNKTPVTFLGLAVCSPLVLSSVSALAQEPGGGSTPGPVTSAAAARTTSLSTPIEPAQSKEQCIERHHQMQVEQNEGNFVHALRLARACTSLVCPGPVVTDCARALNDLELRVPSVVFDVRLDGQPNKAALVVADGNEVTDWAKGDAFKLNPGEHEFRIELAPHQPIVQRVLLGEGIRFRQVVVEFKSAIEPDRTSAKQTVTAAASPAPQLVRTERRTPVIVYPLLGVTALGGAGFAVFAMRGKTRRQSLEEQCMPYCLPEDTKPMKTSYMIADISLGVGAASLLTAALVYFTRPERPVDATIGVAPLLGGASAFASYRF